MATVDVSDLEDLLDELRSLKDIVGTLGSRVGRIETALGGAGAVLIEVDGPTSSAGGAPCSGR